MRFQATCINRMTKLWLVRDKVWSATLFRRRSLLAQAVTTHATDLKSSTDVDLVELLINLISLMSKT